MKRQTREEWQDEHDERKMLLRAYGYNWKHAEQLTEEQLDAVWRLGGPEDGAPLWVLLSPLEMPVNETTILRWLGERGNSSEDVQAFIAEHGFISEGKDERGIWHIQTPSGKETINSRQALEEIERIRIDRARFRERARQRKIQESFEQSVLSLKETLDLHGDAQNDRSAWGYSPYPFAKRLSDGTIEVRTYHFEGEWDEETFKTPEQVVSYLYADGEGTWDPGTRAKSA